jgi:hypothetical protein
VTPAAAVVASSSTRKMLTRIDPVQGSALIFDHDLYHEGEALVGSGLKYALRTDVLFTRRRRRG